MRGRFPNPRLFWREAEGGWVIQYDASAPMHHGHLRRRMPGREYSLLDHLVAVQTGALFSMPDGPEKDRRRRALDALRAGEIRLEPRPGPARGTYEMREFAGGRDG